MSRIFKAYVQKAQQILDNNWTGSSTKPGPFLYPHQWNWDSAFIAIGLSHYNTKRAISEIETLFKAQWTNGMLPQIVFNDKELGHYFPEPDFWETKRSPHAPRDILTSGITMPPVHAIAVEEIYTNARHKKDASAFVENMYPKLLALHTYLYRDRDPFDEGLIYIRHPWESGIDNSPSWDEPLKRILIKRKELPLYIRRDLEHGVAPSMRPSNDDYDRYVFLVDLFRRHNYDETLIRDSCPFLIQDPLFNSILCRANESLVRIARIIGESPNTALAWAEKTSEAIRKKLWHEGHCIFDAYDLANDQLIEVDTAAGFIPLFAGAATRSQAEKIYERLNSASFCSLHQGNCFTVPNYDTQKQGFDRFNYWRGPVWININWMLARGLKRYGYTLKADSLQKDLLQLPVRFGFHEYFDSVDGKGYGSDNFSWTAALFIDLVFSSYKADKFRLSARNRIRGIFSSKIVLNDGNDMPECDTAFLAEELMRSIRTLRDEFYDTNKGLVDYSRIKGSDAYTAYRTLTNGLRRFDPAFLVGRREKLSFWINLYNTIVVDGIITLGVEGSVKEIPGFFRMVSYRIGPHLFCADDIEHGILRGNVRPFFSPLRQFGPKDRRKNYILVPVDPRIHFALVCGSRSCAPIDYYDPARIYDQLEIAAKSFVNSSEVLVIPEDEKLLLSEIFRWYEVDFCGRTGIIDFIFDYLVDEKLRDFIRHSSSSLRLEYLDYDWNLNR